ncbi:hypothetical protein [Metaclostridioides mangenotii]|uniref:hypothetical protein n=1 Tax=Metaclostridioides mangenotii TaxID=1540 RepID=UPI0004648800|nr:hypothetical protein [Clostridioides mangenotii]
MESMIIGTVGILFIALGIIFFIIELKLDLPLSYGFCANSVQKNGLPIILTGIALVFFRNGIDQINSIVTFGIFITIELIVIVLYFIIRSRREI